MKPVCHQAPHNILSSARAWISIVVLILAQFSSATAQTSSENISGERGYFNDAGVQVIPLSPKYNFRIKDSAFQHENIPQGYYLVSKEADNDRNLLIHLNESDIHQWKAPLENIILLSLFFRFGYLTLDDIRRCKQRFLIDSAQTNLSELLGTGYSQIFRLPSEVLESSAACVPKDISSADKPKYSFDQLLTLPNFDSLFALSAKTSIENRDTLPDFGMQILPPSKLSTMPDMLTSPQSKIEPKRNLLPPLAVGQLIRNFNKDEVLEVRNHIVESQVTQNVMMYRPWEILKHLPDNTNRKKDLWWRLDRATKAYERQEKEGKSNPKLLAKAKAAYDSVLASFRKAIEDRRLVMDEELNSYKADELKLKQRISKINKNASRKTLSESDKAVIVQSQQLLSRLEERKKARQEQIKQDVAKINIEKKSTEQIRYTHKIDGYSCTTINAVNTPYTTFYEGLDNYGAPTTRQTLKDVVDGTQYSASVKSILLSVSKNEGKFWTINTYDRMKLTWGMFQWAGGGKSSSLFIALQEIKQLVPSEYNMRFQRFGIDIDEKRHMIKVLTTDGTWKFGPEAAEYIKDNPKLTAVFCIAGQVVDIQTAQISVAVKKQIARALDITLQETPTIRSSHVFTSEFGLGLIVDSIIHEGSGYHGGRKGTLPRIDKSFNQLLSKKLYAENTINTLKECGVIMADSPPKSKPKVAQGLIEYTNASNFQEKFPRTWLACADKFISISFIRKWPDRAVSFNENCGKQPEGFKQ